MNTASTKLFGKYRGQVIEINDPEQRGRILVKCPKVLNNSALGWAESCFMPGHFFLPRKTDFVWIEFEEGDVHKPIWTGIMPTRAYVRDYLFQTVAYYLDASYINNHTGDINMAMRDQYLRSQNSVYLLASNEFKVDASKLTNNNYWSKDDKGLS